MSDVVAMSSAPYDLSDDESPQPRVLVLQMGARLHYAVPAVYARANALDRLYTDACASVGALALARRVIPPRLRVRDLQRLLGRTLPPEVPSSSVRVETLATLTERIRLQFAGRADALISTHERLRQRILRDGFQRANCFYSLDNGDLDLLKAAKEAGLAVVYEQIICPSVGRIMREERMLFPGIEKQDPEEEVERGIARDIEIFRMAHAVVCASNYVRDDVIGLAGPSARAVLCPYGISARWLQKTPAPIPGRILFVGSVGLRKGSHYLAEATRLLQARGVRCDVRVVGPHDPDVISRPEFRGPTYVGQVPRNSVRSEFAQADIFALPTLAEGFAMVHLEAFACGVPVVTTPSCGSQVCDGENGFIVPVRDAHALADRLEQIICDRMLRETMSRAATSRAAELGWDRFGDRLLSATRNALRSAARVEAKPC